MDAGTIKVVCIVGACIAGLVLFSKGETLKKNRRDIEKSETYLTTALPKVFAFNDFTYFSEFMGRGYDKQFYEELKLEYGSCTTVSGPKCKPYIRPGGGCPYTRESMRCYVNLNCQKNGHITAVIDLSRSGNGVNALSFIK